MYPGSKQGKSHSQLLLEHASKPHRMAYHILNLWKEKHELSDNINEQPTRCHTITSCTKILLTQIKKLFI